MMAYNPMLDQEEEKARKEFEMQNGMSGQEAVPTDAIPLAPATGNNGLAAGGLTEAEINAAIARDDAARAAAANMPQVNNGRPLSGEAVRDLNAQDDRAQATNQVHGIFGQANPNRYKPGMTFGQMAQQDAADEMARWRELREANRAGRTAGENRARDLRSFTSMSDRKAYIAGEAQAQQEMERAAGVQKAKYAADAAAAKNDVARDVAGIRAAAIEAAARERAASALGLQNMKGEQKQQQLTQQNDFKAAEAQKEREAKAAEAEKDRVAKAALANDANELKRWSTTYNSASQDKRLEMELALKKQIAESRNDSAKYNAMISSLARIYAGQPPTTSGRSADNFLDKVGLKEEDIRRVHAEASKIR